MTEKTYFWDHGTGGDAVYSPYNAAEFNPYMFLPLTGGVTSEGYVIPDYLDNLWVRSAGDTAHSIVVYPGAALVNNYIYVSDETKAISVTRPLPGTSRRDLVVLQYKTTGGNPVIRVLIKEGGAVASNPSEPVLTQNSGTWEIALAAIYTDGDNTYLSDSFVQDRRRFLPTPAAKQHYGINNNLLRNSEWLVTSASSSAIDEWISIMLTSTHLFSPITSGGAAVGYGSGRGNWGIQGASVTGVEEYGIGQWVSVGGSQTFTLRGSWNTVSGLGGLITGIRGFTSNGQASSVYKEMAFVEGNSNSYEYQMTVTFPETDIVMLFVYFVATRYAVLGSTPQGNIGQPVLVPGFFPGDYRATHDIISLHKVVNDGSWSASAKSTGTTVIDLEVSFADRIRPYTRAIILRLRGRDSGSAAGAPYMQIKGYASPFVVVYGELSLEGVTNDVWRETYCIAPVDQIYWNTGTAGARFLINIVATGASTFDATVEIVGAIV